MNTVEGMLADTTACTSEVFASTQMDRVALPARTWIVAVDNTYGMMHNIAVKHNNGLFFKHAFNAYNNANFMDILYMIIMRNFIVLGVAAVPVSG